MPEKEYNKEIWNKAIDDLVSETMKRVDQFEDERGYPTAGDVERILKDTAKKMKEVGE